MPVATIRFVYFLHKRKQDIPEAILSRSREAVNHISRGLLESLIERGYADVRLSEKTNLGARTVSFMHEFFLKFVADGEGSEQERRLDNDLKAIQTGFEHAIMREKNTLLSQMEVDSHFEKISFDCTIEVLSCAENVAGEAWIAKTRLDAEPETGSEADRPFDDVEQIEGQLADIFKQAKENNGD